MPAYDFGKLVFERFIKPKFQGNDRSIERCYLDPANFGPNYDIRVGLGGLSIADQMKDVLYAHPKIAVMEGARDRAGGWQLLHVKLARGEWLISKSCEKLIAAIPSRQFDPKKEADVLKVKGDPLDDAMDAARYGLYSWETSAEKPQELVIAEKMKPYVGDPYSLMQYQRIKDEVEGVQPRHVRPARFVRSAIWRDGRRWWPT